MFAVVSWVLDEGFLGKAPANSANGMDFFHFTKFHQALEVPFFGPSIYVLCDYHLFCW